MGIVEAFNIDTDVKKNVLTDLILARRLNILLKPITLTQMSIFFLKHLILSPDVKDIFESFDTHLILSPDVKDIFESFDTVPRCQRYF